MLEIKKDRYISQIWILETPYDNEMITLFKDPDEDFHFTWRTRIYDLSDRSNDTIKVREGKIPDKTEQQIINLFDEVADKALEANKETKLQKLLLRTNNGEKIAEQLGSVSGMTVHKLTDEQMEEMKKQIETLEKSVQKNKVKKPK